MRVMRAALSRGHTASTRWGMNLAEGVLICQPVSSGARAEPRLVQRDRRGAGRGRYVVTCRIVSCRVGPDARVRATPPGSWLHAWA